MASGVIPKDKQAAALRYYAMALDAKKLAKSAEAFRLAYGVDLHAAFAEAKRTVDRAEEGAAAARS